MPNRRSRHRPARPAPLPQAAERPAWPVLHALVSIAAVAVFARAVPYPLQASWDDGRFIIANPDVQAVSLEALRSFWARPHFEAYHPLHLMSYWLDVPWAGAHGPTLHAVSLGLWVVALNVLLRAMVALGLSGTGALLATLACGLHPVQVEAVSWASGRKDVLALLFAAAAILFHARSERMHDARAWLSRLCFVLAALAKTTVLPLPAVLALGDVLLRGRSARDALVRQLPAFVLGAGLGVGVVAIWLQNEMVRTTAGGAAALPVRVAATFAHQLGTALWPSATSPMYSTRAVATAGAAQWLVVLAYAATGLLLWRSGARRGLFALAGFALWLAPVSNAVPMYFPFQDRYLSLPLVPLAFGLGAAYDALALSTGPRWLLPAFGALIVALGLRCVQYQGEWASETRLWGHAASTHPDAYYALIKLGEVRRDAGDLYGAVRAYKQLLTIDPARKLSHAALLSAVALRDERVRGLAPSRAEEYAKDYYAALEDADALLALASRMMRSGHLRALELPLARAIALRPMADNALERAAAVQFEAGRPTVGAFYLRMMRRPTERADLKARADAIAPLLAASPL